MCIRDADCRGIFVAFEAYLQIAPAVFEKREKLISSRHIFKDPLVLVVFSSYSIYLSLLLFLTLILFIILLLPFLLSILLLFSFFTLITVCSILSYPIPLIFTFD